MRIMIRFAELLFVALTLFFLGIAIGEAGTPSHSGRAGPGYGGHDDAQLDASGDDDDGRTSYARMARECNATDLDAGEGDDDASFSARAAAASGRRRHLRRSDASAVDGRNLRRGSIVELRAEDGRFAVPAIVLGSRGDENDSSTTTRYSVRNLITDECLSGVESELVHPYEAYADGTRAYCNVGEDPDGVRTTPCVVDSHSTRKSGVVLYQVSYLDSEEEDALVEDYLPFSRVRRIRGSSSGSRMK